MSGEVEHVTLIQPESVAPEVERALLAEAKSWRFRPATLRGRPLAVSMDVSLDHCPLRRTSGPAG